MKTVLVTGGVGFIGSHTVVELAKEGYKIIILDNLSNSDLRCLEKMKEITKKEIIFFNTDIRDENGLSLIFDQYNIDAVLHFAGHKSVEESISQPLKYYSNNVYGTLILLKVMNKFGVKKIVFSSSATVYGAPNELPLKESSKLNKTSNTYGETKLIVENMLSSLFNSDREWSINCLRYFNPIGASSSGKIGENPKGKPNNLMPYLCQVASGIREQLSIYGNDYETDDGTGVRDYIHVVDLAKGHIHSLKNILLKNEFNIFNLGTGNGYSVLEVIEMFEKVSKKKIPYEFAPRRQGDLPILYSDVSKSKKILKWRAEKTLEDMCIDSWNWQKNNPKGY